MSNFSFSSPIHGRVRDYMVKTMNFESIHRVIVNIHCQDRVINSREVDYDEKLLDDELMGFIKRTHDERVGVLNGLMEISAKLLEKEDRDANQKLGMVFLSNGMSAEAISEFERALSLDTQNAAVLNQLGLAYLLEEKLESAEQALRHAIAFKSEYPDLHNNLGLVLLRNEQYAEAEKELKLALTLHHGYAEASFNLGLCLVSQSAVDAGTWTEERKSQVQKYLTDAVELDPGCDNEYYKVAQNYLAKSQLAEAKQALAESRAPRTGQSDHEIHHEFYLRLKYGSEGVDRVGTQRYIKRLEMLLEKHPSFVDVHNDLGVAYLIQSRFLFNQSINEFKHALDINPNYEKSRKNLKLAENEGKGFLLLLRAILYF